MDIICFSHLRWNFVYQRPQHLMSRFAGHFNVYFIEEPIFDASSPYLDDSLNTQNVRVIVPHLPEGTTWEEAINQQEKLIKKFISDHDIENFIAWYYTPMALFFTSDIKPSLIVFDCMDELSAFKDAPQHLKEKEAELLQKADIVFTGGHSLYEAKKSRHHNVHCFPSSIDRQHFEKARQSNIELEDQLEIPFPRIGFSGVIDERMDIKLVEEMALKRPDWNFVMIGPVVKIDPATLPRHSNIYYLGSKPYADLPYYLSGWDVAMMPFAINESTRYISPTKTPEYLAAGKPVVSTAIHDVVRDYGEQGLAYIASTSDEFIESIRLALNMKNKDSFIKAVDAKLAQNSWDRTCEKMMFLINTVHETKKNDKIIQKKEDEYV
jgi:glycosyltransferase involved in cell wall biosynthesis